MPSSSTGESGLTPLALCCLKPCAAREWAVAACRAHAACHQCRPARAWLFLHSVSFFLFFWSLACLLLLPAPDHGCASAGASAPSVRAASWRSACGEPRSSQARQAEWS